MFLADLPAKHHRHERGNEADAHFRVTEFRLGNGQREVRKRGQPTAAGNRRAIYGGDQRLWETVNEVKHFRHAARVREILLGGLFREGLQGFKVHPGAKSFSGTGENYNADGFIRFGCTERGEEIVNHGCGNGVAFFRAIQSKRHDFAVALEF